LVSIRKGGDLESTIFGYDVSTGINKFIKEFPRVDNQSVALDIIERYNIIIDDDKAILVLLATRGGVKKLCFLILRMAGQNALNSAYITLSTPPLFWSNHSDPK